MSYFLCKIFLRHGRRRRPTIFGVSPVHNLCFIVETNNKKNHPSLLSSSLASIRCISSDSNPNRYPFAVSYLINKCEFSPESALSASKYVKFKTPANPDAVIGLLKRYGLSQEQIFKLIRKYPRMLSMKAEKTLLPKLEFFKSKGFSSTVIAQVFFVAPPLLTRSLENRITHNFNFLSTLLQSNDKVIPAAKRYPWILHDNYKIRLIPNMDLLLDIGVPKSHITTLIFSWPISINVHPNLFKKSVETVREMGFDPSQAVFMRAVMVLRKLGKSGWEEKVGVYKSWGWSEQEILAAFRKEPWSIMASKDKIMAVMDFLVNEMGCEPSFIAKNPALLTRGLNKTIIPRASVIQFLLSKGLIIRKPSLLSLFIYPEKLFLKKFVDCFDESPQLLKLYREKLSLSK